MKGAYKAMAVLGAFLVALTAPKLYFSWTETAFIAGAVMMAVGVTNAETGEEDEKWEECED